MERMKRVNDGMLIIIKLFLHMQLIRMYLMCVQHPLYLTSIRRIEKKEKKQKVKKEKKERVKKEKKEKVKKENNRKI